jgi:hypothetical protein
MKEILGSNAGQRNASGGSRHRDASQVQIGRERAILGNRFLLLGLYEERYPAPMATALGQRSFR